jgi:hypothetical protein
MRVRETSGIRWGVGGQTPKGSQSNYMLLCYLKCIYVSMMNGREY